MKLRYVGRRFINSLTQPILMQGILKEMADLDPNEEIELFEETRKETCTNLISDMKSVGVPFDMELSFSEQEISNGGIICFQKNSETQQMTEYKYPYVEEFLKYMRDHQIVHFRSLKRPKDDGFCLILSMVDGYEVLVKKMALKLDLEDYLKIRITQHNLYSQQPELHPFGHREKELLRDMLVQDDEISDVLYYELLDIPLPELECLKTLKVAFHHAFNNEVVIHNIQLPKESTVKDFLNEIRKKVKLSHPTAEL